MSRLTVNNLDKVAYSPWELCGIDTDCVRDCKDCPINKIYLKLAHYEDLEEAGRLIELPCALGDTVYKLTTKCEKHKCPPISCEQCDFDKQFIGIRKFRFGYDCIYLLERELGKTVFLTKAEAEEALKRLQENEKKL